MKNLLLCTKDVHFSYNNEIYTQTDGVAIGSLGIGSSTHRYVYGWIRKNSITNFEWICDSMEVICEPH